jgi:hypothetical protein
MNHLLLSCRNRSTELCELTIESFLALSLWKFLNGREEIGIKIVVDGTAEATTIAVNHHEITGEIEFVEHDEERRKKLPMFLIDNGDYSIVGLCSVLRAICRLMQTSEKSGKLASLLLGYNESCLLAPSEVSLWTHFCEREMILCAERLLQCTKDDKIEFPIEMLKLETEFSNPVRCHNVFKLVRDAKKNRALQSDDATKVDLEHKYCYGNEASLSDFMLYVIFKLIFVTVEDGSMFKNSLPLVLKWFHNMEDDFESLRPTITKLLIDGAKVDVHFKEELPTVAPNGQCFSLFNRQLRGQKARSKIQKKFVVQSEIDVILSKLKSMNVEIKSEPGNEHDQNSLSDSFIEELLTRGELPADRFERKKYQLKSVAVEVLKIARDKDVIVDFCSGTGHLGLLIANLLPNCRIIILENKEESIKRAKQKSKTLRLSNVSFYQCNLVSNFLKRQNKLVY